MPDGSEKRGGGMGKMSGAAGGPADPAGSLEIDLRAGFFERGFGLLGVFLAGALENGLRHGLDEFLGILEAEAGQAADLFDDRNLLGTLGDEDDIVMENGMFYPPEKIYSEHPISK